MPTRFKSGPSLSRLRELLKYDPATGVFTWRERRGPRVAGAQAGSVKNAKGYRYIRLDGALHFEHRLAWLYETGEWPAEEIDHINGDASDNRIENLREATRGQNAQNLAMSPKNTSGYRGVCWDPVNGKWCAQIHAGRHVKLGRFDTLEAANSAYLKAKQKLHTFQPVPRDLE